MSKRSKAFNAEFEKQKSLLIEELTAMAETPGT
jgi:hypothetical protein